MLLDIVLPYRLQLQLQKHLVRFVIQILKPSFVMLLAPIYHAARSYLLKHIDKPNQRQSHLDPIQV